MKRKEIDAGHERREKMESSHSLCTSLCIPFTHSFTGHMDERVVSFGWIFVNIISATSHGWKMLSGLFFSCIHAVIRWAKKVAHGWTVCLYHLSRWRGCTRLTLVYIIHLLDDLFALMKNVCTCGLWIFEMLFFRRTVLSLGGRRKNPIQPIRYKHLESGR